MSNPGTEEAPEEQPWASIELGDDVAVSYPVDFDAMGPEDPSSSVSSAVSSESVSIDQLSTHHPAGLSPNPTWNLLSSSNLLPSLSLLPSSDPLPDSHSDQLPPDTLPLDTLPPLISTSSPPHLAIEIPASLPLPLPPPLACLPPEMLPPPPTPVPEFSSRSSTPIPASSHRSLPIPAPSYSSLPIPAPSPISSPSLPNNPEDQLDQLESKPLAGGGAAAGMGLPDDDAEHLLCEEAPDDGVPGCEHGDELEERDVEGDFPPQPLQAEPEVRKASFTNWHGILLLFTWDGFREYFSELLSRMWVDSKHWFYSRRRSYFWMHLIIWTAMALALGGILVGTGAGGYADGLFMATSALSATGLATINLNSASVATQVVIFFCMWVSGAVFESTIPLTMSVDVVRAKHRRRLEVENWPNDVPPPPPPPEKKAVYLCITVAYLYYGVLQVLFFLIVGYFFQFSTAGKAIMDLNNLTPWWFSLFQISSAFNNCGFSLLPDSLMQIATFSWPLTCLALMVLLGNTAYPIAFRAILRGLYKIYSFLDYPDSEAFSFILQNPRTYMTHMFPSYHTWLLMWALIGMTAVQTVLLAIFSYDNPAFDHLEDPGHVFSNMLFQSISVRTAGINTIDFGLLNTSSLILMIIMMYVSAYPVTVLLRSSNSEGSEEENALGYQAKRMLIDDLTWVVLPWYLISSFESTASFAEGFKILFEVVSAYGTVGLSMGIAGQTISLSGSFSVPSKLVMVLVMMMGRHRGMPDNIDGAVDINGVWEVGDERFREYTKHWRTVLAEEAVEAAPAPVEGQIDGEAHQDVAAAERDDFSGPSSHGSREISSSETP